VSARTESLALRRIEAAILRGFTEALLRFNGDPTPTNFAHYQEASRRLELVKVHATREQGR
jgi:hypothetical protein